jgi:hypothetical protein
MVADTLRGIDTKWDLDYLYDLEMRYQGSPFVEVEWHDEMDVLVRVRHSVSEFSDVRVLIHCDGQELELDTNSWHQLRRRLADIA